MEVGTLLGCLAAECDAAASSAASHAPWEGASTRGAFARFRREGYPGFVGATNVVEDEIERRLGARWDAREAERVAGEDAAWAAAAAAAAAGTAKAGTRARVGSRRRVGTRGIAPGRRRTDAPAGPPRRGARRGDGAPVPPRRAQRGGDVPAPLGRRVRAARAAAAAAAAGGGGGGDRARERRHSRRRHSRRRRGIRTRRIRAGPAALARPLRRRSANTRASG